MENISSVDTTTFLTVSSTKTSSKFALEISFETIIDISWHALHIFLIVTSGCLTVFGLFLNGLVIVLYFMNSIRNTVHNSNILQLAICDLLSCLIVLVPHHLELYEWTWLDTKRWCWVTRYLHYFFGLESTFLVIVISLDRVFLVNYGGFYRKHCTRLLSNLGVICSWCLAVALVTPLVVVTIIRMLSDPAQPVICSQADDAKYEAFKWICACLNIFMTCSMVIITVSIMWALAHVPEEVVIRERSHSCRRLTSIPTLVQRTKFVKRMRLARSRRVIFTWCLMFFSSWTVYASALTVEVWMPGSVPKYWLTFLAWIFLSKHALDPFLYARYISAFRRRLVDLQDDLKHTRFIPPCCTTLSCLFCYLSEIPRLRSARTYDSLRQRVLQECANDNSTTTSFRLDSSHAIDYLWRDPRAMRGPRLARTESRSLSNWKHLSNFSHTSQKDSQSYRWILPIIMTTSSFSHLDSSSSESSTISLNNILQKQFTCKTSSISSNSFCIVDEQEFIGQKAFTDQFRETEV